MYPTINLCKPGTMSKCTGKDKLERKMCYYFMEFEGDCSYYRKNIDGHCDCPKAQAENRIKLREEDAGEVKPHHEAPVLDDEAVKEQKEGFIPT